MYARCPKCGHQRRAGDGESVEACPACGVIYEKWLKARLASARPPDEDVTATPRGSHAPWVEALLARCFHVEATVNPIVFGGRAVVFVGLVVWGVYFVRLDHRLLYGGLPLINESFMHLVNLVFHEAGHVVFSILGDFMAVLGGSLLQVLMPLILLGAFVFKHNNPFGGVVALWWTGQSLMDLAPYIHDARRGEMILLGGVTGRDAPGYHDWSNLLGRLGWMQYDQSIAAFVDFAGTVVMALAFVWGAWVLYLQYQRIGQPG